MQLIRRKPTLPVPVSDRLGIGSLVRDVLIELLFYLRSRRERFPGFYSVRKGRRMISEGVSLEHEPEPLRPNERHAVINGKLTRIKLD